jgi:protocatechuate 3,4-dioxygenase beta subunit
MPSHLATDLAALATRRRALGLGALGLGGALAACNEMVSARTLDDAAKCLATPTEIRGPFPADGTRAGGRALNVLGNEALIRRDIRPSFAGMTGTAEGVQLDCAIKLVDAAGCTPLAGRALYLWQCDAVGDYSLYNPTDVNFLRGLQVSGADGVVSFTTIVPGCYGGRAPHVHLEVFESIEAASNGANSLLVSQLALDEAECARVYRARSEYGSSMANLRQWPAEGDFAFSGSDEARAAQTISLTGDPAKGYVGEATVSLG